MRRIGRSGPPTLLVDKGDKGTRGGQRTGDRSDRFERAGVGALKNPTSLKLDL